MALARAVAAAPDFLLLDEPFAALDGQRRRAFIQVLSDVHRNYRLPIMVVTHDIDDAAALATHLVALNNGAVVAQGPFTHASRSPEFQALLDSADIGTAMPASSMRSFTAASRSGSGPIRCYSPQKNRVLFRPAMCWLGRCVP